jgi:hypothetical protein
LRLDGAGQLTLIGLFARCAPHDVLATRRVTIVLRRLLRNGRWFAPLTDPGHRGF